MFNNETAGNITQTRPQEAIPNRSIKGSGQKRACPLVRLISPIPKRLFKTMRIFEICAHLSFFVQPLLNAMSEHLYVLAVLCVQLCLCFPYQLPTLDPPGKDKFSKILTTKQGHSGIWVLSNIWQMLSLFFCCIFCTS